MKFIATLNDIMIDTEGGVMASLNHPLLLGVIEANTIEEATRQAEELEAKCYYGYGYANGYNDKPKQVESGRSHLNYPTLKVEEI